MNNNQEIYQNYNNPKKNTQYLEEFNNFKYNNNQYNNPQEMQNQNSFEQQINYY